MRKDKIMKLVGLNTGIVAVDTILFSPGLIGLALGGSSIFATAFGTTAILMSIVVFFYGNYNLINEEEQIIQTRDIRTEEDCIYALEICNSKKTFREDVTIILEQIERFQKKKETIKDILLQKFSSTEMSYSKFEGTILDVENIFFINVKSIINKLNAFDEEEYLRLSDDRVTKKISRELLDNKMNIYREYINFVKNAIDDNEEIILKLDKLLLEISKFNSLEDGEIEEMSAMVEIDELIDKAKYYK